MDLPKLNEPAQETCKDLVRLGQGFDICLPRLREICHESFREPKARCNLGGVVEPKAVPFGVGREEILAVAVGNAPVVFAMRQRERRVVDDRREVRRTKM